MKKLVSNQILGFRQRRGLSKILTKGCLLLLLQIFTVQAHALPSRKRPSIEEAVKIRLQFIAENAEDEGVPSREKLVPLLRKGLASADVETRILALMLEFDHALDLYSSHPMDQKADRSLGELNSGAMRSLEAHPEILRRMDLDRNQLETLSRIAWERPELQAVVNEKRKNLDDADASFERRWEGAPAQHLRGRNSRPQPTAEEARRFKASLGDTQSMMNIALELRQKGDDLSSLATMFNENFDRTGTKDTLGGKITAFLLNASTTNAQVDLNVGRRDLVNNAREVIFAVAHHERLSNMKYPIREVMNLILDSQPTRAEILKMFAHFHLTDYERSTTEEAIRELFEQKFFSGLASNDFQNFLNGIRQYGVSSVEFLTGLGFTDEEQIRLFMKFKAEISKKNINIWGDAILAILDRSPQLSQFYVDMLKQSIESNSPFAPTRVREILEKHASLETRVEIGKLIINRLAKRMGHHWRSENPLIPLGEVLQPDVIAKLPEDSVRRLGAMVAAAGVQGFLGDARPFAKISKESVQQAEARFAPVAAPAPPEAPSFFGRLRNWCAGRVVGELLHGG